MEHYTTEKRRRKARIENEKETWRGGVRGGRGQKITERTIWEITGALGAGFQSVEPGRWPHTLFPFSLSPSIGEANSSLLLLPHPCRPFCIFYSAFHVLPRATRKSTVNNARSSEPRPALPACRIAETLFSFCGTRKYVSEDWPRYRPNNSKLNFMPAKVQKNKVWRNNWWIIKLFVRDEEWWKAKLWRDIGKIKETWLIYLAR